MASIGKGCAWYNIYQLTNCRKTASYEENENSPSPRHCSVSQVESNDGKIAGISLRIAFISTAFYRFRLQRVLSARESEEGNVCRKELSLQLRGDPRDLSILRVRYSLLRERHGSVKRRVRINALLLTEIILMNEVTVAVLLVIRRPF